jgi:hypothetical protein
MKAACIDSISCSVAIKNTLKTFRLSHDVGNVSVVSVTNQSTQEHFGVPQDSVSRISCLTLPLIVCGGGARSASAKP